MRQVSLTELLEDGGDDQPVRVVTREDAKTLWSTEEGSLARLLVSHGPLEL